MAHTYEELKKQTVAQLRELAKGSDHEAIHGYSTMHKEDLVVALCKAFGIEAHEHHEVVGVDKAKVRAQIAKLKEKRAAAIEAHDSKQLKFVRRNIHALKHKLRKAMV
ncbi:MAG: hypothetical protein ACE5D4_02430 [Thermodesulfobacteriota bacterium]